MLGISNTTRSSLKKFVKDLVSSSPDLQNKINTLSPISFSIKVDFLDALFIQINDDGVNIDFAEHSKFDSKELSRMLFNCITDR